MQAVYIIATQQHNLHHLRQTLISMYPPLGR